MHLTAKQSEALRILQDDKTTELLFGGGAGGGKSALGCFWQIKNRLRYPGTRGVIGRAQLKTLKETTLKTFFEVASYQGLKSDVHYRYQEQKGLITFVNKSEILLKDMFFYPADPDFDELGSLEITDGFIDEASQIVEKAKNILISRMRYKTKEFNLIPKLLLTCNPTKNFLYKEFYLPSKEGTISSDKAFVQALATDNIHLPKHYEGTILKLDKDTIQRLLYGNWEYADDPSILCDYGSIISIFTNTFSLNLADKKYLTADIAFQGSDRFVLLAWSGWSVIDHRIIPKLEADEVTDHIKEMAEKHSVQRCNITYDCDGLGSYLRGYLRGAIPFVNNSTPVEIKNVKKDNKKEQYQNLKSQCGFMLADKINSGGLYIIGMRKEHQALAIEELAELKKETKDTGKLKLISKDVMKAMLKRSPDIMDALLMRGIFDLKHTGGKIATSTTSGHY